jgi:hypothetical protein
LIELTLYCPEHIVGLRVADGELESFMLVPVAQVANVIHKTKHFKPNYAIVIIDFFFSAMGT